MDWTKKKELLCNELEELLANEKPNPNNLHLIDMLTHSIKSIATIDAMERAEEEREMGYSGDDYSGARRRDSMGRYSGNRYSGAQTRDTMGRYSGDDYAGDGEPEEYSGARRRYSGDTYRRRYSGAEDPTMEARNHLRSAMQSAQDETTREALRNAMRALEH